MSIKGWLAPTGAGPRPAGYERRRLVGRVVCGGAVLLMFCVVLPGQSGPSKDSPLSSARVAPALKKVADAAGQRFLSSGAERWTGQMDIESGDGQTLIKGLRATLEWPGRLRLEGPGNAVVFRPDTASRGEANAVGQDVAEVFLEDSIDGFLAAHLSDAALRVVGSGYPDPTRPGNAALVVSLIMPSRTKADKRTVARQYWFDATTRLLVRVVHSEPGDETRFSDWQDFQGNRFPGRITVVRSRAIKYRIALRVDSLGAKRDDGVFDPN